MNSVNHIVRTGTDFFDGNVIHFDGNRLMDNEMNIIANIYAFEIEPTGRYNCDVINFRNGDARAIILDGQIYDLSQMGEVVDEWLNVGIITEDEYTTLAAIVNYLVWQPQLTWDLNYHFPCYYNPMMQRDLMSANIWMFIKQFPSEEYIIDLFTGSTVETWDETTDGTSVITFDWEYLMDEFTFE
jgi:hypothetical protein